ncbi:MAG: helix-turn-helix transcriptional regulator [Clostridia bacterium]|nr:helix-turn-helix transcriptional regulator [Clostridia bacterium]
MSLREIAPNCKEEKLHPAQMEHAGACMPPEEELFALADLYKIFGDSTRIKILYVLYETELCVCDIAALLGMQISAISHQLRILKQARLVKFRRAGKTVYYSLADDHIHSILAQGMEHISEEK